ncbi:hypothetical protein [Undibacterium sp. TC9W]|uniref:hypothetical protein n=1 Tax=Undibacterium sp. TC9W TaxID=3413053 RepID=UPI003BF405FD
MPEASSLPMQRMQSWFRLASILSIVMGVGYMVQDIDINVINVLLDFEGYR